MSLVCSSFSQLHDLQANAHSLHTSFRGPATAVGAPISSHQHHHALPAHLHASAAFGSGSAAPSPSSQEVEGGIPPGFCGPPGNYLGENPDMTDPVNIQWYEMKDIPPEDPRWGRILPPDEDDEQGEGEFGVGSLDDAGSQARHDGEQGEEEDQEEREPTPEPVPVRPIFPLVSFGFGGRIVCVFPQYEQEEEQGEGEQESSDVEGADDDELQDEWAEGIDIAPGDSVSCQVSEDGSAVGDNGVAADGEGSEGDVDAGPKALGCNIVIHSLARLVEDDAGTGVNVAAGQEEDDEEGEDDKYGEETDKEEDMEEEKGEGEAYDEDEDEGEAAQGVEEPTPLLTHDSTGHNRCSEKLSVAAKRRRERARLLAAARAELAVLRQGDVSHCLLGAQGLTPAGVAQLVQDMASQLEGLGFGAEKALLCRVLASMCKHGFPQPPSEEGLLSLTPGLLDQLSTLLKEASERVAGAPAAASTTAAATTAATESSGALGGGGADDEKRRAGMAAMEALLLAGQREAACKVALEANLWEHALILGWYTSPELHKRVITRYTGLVWVHVCLYVCLYVCLCGFVCGFMCECVNDSGALLLVHVAVSMSRFGAPHPHRHRHRHTQTHTDTHTRCCGPCLSAPVRLRIQNCRCRLQLVPPARRALSGVCRESSRRAPGCATAVRRHAAVGRHAAGVPQQPNTVWPWQRRARREERGGRQARKEGMEDKEWHA